MRRRLRQVRPTSVATTGSPSAMASSSAIGMPSFSDGSTKTSIAGDHVVDVAARHRESEHASAIPSRDASA